MPDDCRCACPPRPPRGWALALALAGSAAPGLAEPPPELALPPVPEALIAEASATRPAPGRTTPAPPSHLELGPMTVTVTPGVNVLAEIAIDQLNRILTPFPNPQVRTVSEASTQVDGSAVYLATATETPVTLFISDAAHPNQALSLTLAPRRIPPRELRLVLSEPLAPSIAGTAPPASPGASAPAAVERLIEALRALAQEALPDGYSLRPARRDETVVCRQDGLETSRGQVLEGHDLTLITALVRNRSEQRLEIEERACRARQGGETIAVAAWPQVWLEPGAAVELYLAVRPTPVERLSPARPSLLEAGRR